MRHREKILLLDVETANTTEDPFVYDIGFIVTDRKGKIYERHSYIIYDIYRLERDLMQSCYYVDKLVGYESRLKNGDCKMINFWTLRKTIRETMKKHDVKIVAAYNAAFDVKALNTTSRYIYKSKKYLRWFFPYGTKYWCIWHMATQVICSQAKYQRWARDNGFYSPSGNIKTDAETVYRFLIGDAEFQEEHRGIEDVEIEAQIMAWCFSRKKKMKKNIFRGCWRIPNTKELKKKYGEI